MTSEGQPGGNAPEVKAGPTVTPELAAKYAKFQEVIAERKGEGTVESIASPATGEPLTREQEISSLSSRISQDGGRFLRPIDRDLLIAEGKFTPQEVEAILKTGVVSGAEGGEVVNFDESKGGKNWMQAVGETADLVALESAPASTKEAPQ